MKTTMAERDSKAMQLLTEYRQGSTRAFSSLYDMYLPMMLNYGKCLTSDMELIRDCIQDVFVRLLDNKHPLKVAKISSYLVISLRNRLMDEFRHATFDADIPMEKLDVKTDDEGAEVRYITHETTATNHYKLQNLLAALTPRQRQAFQLYYLDGRKYEEVCEVMNMNYHSVRNLVHRGMVRMRAVAV